MRRQTRGVEEVIIVVGEHGLAERVLLGDTGPQAFKYGFRRSLGK